MKVNYLTGFNFGYMIIGMGSSWKDFSLCFDVNNKDSKRQKILGVAFKSF